MQITYKAPGSPGHTLIRGINWKPHGFELQENERIVCTEVNHGHFIDCIRFRTDSGRTVGPFGGSGGIITYYEDFSNKGVWLAFFRGYICSSRSQRVVLCRVQMAWSNRERDVNLHNASLLGDVSSTLTTVRQTYDGGDNVDEDDDGEENDDDGDNDDDNDDDEVN